MHPPCKAERPAGGIHIPVSEGGIHDAGGLTSGGSEQVEVGISVVGGFGIYMDAGSGTV